MALAAAIVFPALSDATPLGLPMVTTGAATAVSNVSATLNGTVNPNDDDPTATYDYTFSWGTDQNSLNSSDGGSIGGGASDQPVSLSISNLDPNTTYFFQLCAANADDSTDSSCGAVLSFTTQDKPAVTLGSASAVTNVSATLGGNVDPNGNSTTFVFHYGPSSSTTCGGYPSTSAGGSAGSGTTSTPVSDSISGLTPNTKYFFRLSASNDYGTTCSGSEGSFTTPDAPASVTGSATAVGASTATVGGTVDPNGASVSSAVFKYCTGCANASSGVSVAASPSPGSGTSPVTVSADLTGLQSGSLFHYELCATNAYGTSCGSDKTFTTDTPPTAVLTSDKNTGPTPFTVMFDGSGSSDPDQGDSVASYSFTFGDGSSVTQATPTVSHTYTNPCSPCTATLTVTDKEGAQSAPATLVIHATANQPPVATLTSTPTPATGTAPLAVTFDGSASNDPDGIALKSWSLDFGDSSTAATGTGAVPNAIKHTYSAAGTYKAKLTVTDSSNASTTSSLVTVTVNPQPTISVADVTQAEGNSGTTNFVFVVTLSTISTQDVTVDYKTADGTATAGSDYTAVNATLKIPANTDCTTSPATNAACQIPVSVIGDTIYENDETFALNLSNPTNATLANNSAAGKIVNDDQPPELMIENGATLEGNTGSKVDPAAGSQNWVAGGSLKLADASGFPNSSGAHTFYIATPGSASVSAPFTYNGVSGNTLTGVTPGGSVTVGQIAYQPRTIGLGVLVCDPVKTKDSNPADCVPISSGLDTTVQYSTTNGQSDTTDIPVIQGQDYVHAAGTLTIKAGQQTGSLTFQTIPNTTPENPGNPQLDLTRWFTVILATPTNATIAWKFGTATILEDDGLNQPVATTGAASAVGTDRATVSATVNPNGADTNVYVQYGPTDSYGSQTAPQLVKAGSSQTLNFSLAGLAPGTTYHYQVVATHSDNSTGYGQDATFKTDTPPTAVLKPDKTSGSPPLMVTFDGSGSSDKDGSIASWTLAFGDGASTGGSGAPPSAITHTYASSCSCAASLTVTDNQGGKSAPATVVITVGSKKSGPNPKLSTYTIALSPTSAKIVFPVDPNGATTNVWIDYGTALPYDHRSAVQPIPAGARQTLTFTLTGLTPRTAYHFRLNAVHTTDSGAVHSQDLPFTTPPQKPMRLTLKARSVRVTAKGMVPLPLLCGGNLLTRCKAHVLLELGNLAAGSKTFSVPQGHRKMVSVKLKKAVLARLLASGRLRLSVSISVQTGEGFDLFTKHITLLAPRK